MVIGATNPSAERRERAAIRAVLEKIRPPIDVDAMFSGEELVVIVIVAALPFYFSACFLIDIDASRGELERMADGGRVSCVSDT